MLGTRDAFRVTITIGTVVVERPIQQPPERPCADEGCRRRDHPVGGGIMIKICHRTGVASVEVGRVTGSLCAALVRRALGGGTSGDPPGGSPRGLCADLGRGDDADAGRRRGPGGGLPLHRGDYRRGRGHRGHQASRAERGGGNASARRHPRRGQAGPPLVRLLELRRVRQAIDRRGPRGKPSPDHPGGAPPLARGDSRPASGAPDQPVRILRGRAASTPLASSMQTAACSRCGRTSAATTPWTS